MLYSMVFHVFSGSNPMVALWICISFFGILTAALSMIYFDHAVIIGSSLAGAYMFGRVRIYFQSHSIQGISEYGGGFPNEFLLYQQFAIIRTDGSSTMGQIPSTFFGYFMVMAMCATLSITFQLKQREMNVDMYNYRKYDFKYRKV